MPRRNRGLDFNASGNWQQRGFQNQAAARSVSKEFGLMQQPGGGWGRPTMGQVQGIANAWGQGRSQPVQTPYDIGGARWMLGAGGAQYTGQAAGGGGAYHPNLGGPGGAAPGNIAGGGHPQPFRTQIGNRRGNVGGQGGGGGGGQGPGARNFGRPNQGGGGGGPRPINFPQGPGGGQSQGQAAQGQGYPGFPPMPQRPPNFLPMTPQFEAAQRGANDQYSAQMMNLTNQQGLIDPAIQLQMSRMGTDVGYAKSGLQEDLANRGMYQSGSYPYLYQRDIGIPYGRNVQDMLLGAAGQYGDIAGGMGQAGLGYNQQMMEALLNRAAQVAAEPPMASPQFGYRPPRQNPRRVKPRGRRNKGRGSRGKKK